jgi:hypothetical protein
MRHIFLTNAQFGYIHLYACSLHGLPTGVTEGFDGEDAQELCCQPQPSKAGHSFLDRFAERLALIFLVDKTPAKNV